MALPVRHQAIWWSLALAVLLVALWGLGSVLTPFLVGGGIAYFLDPVADRLERAGLSRVLATSAISALALLVLVLLVLLVVPTLVRQLTDLVNAAPQMFADLQSFLKARFPEAMQPDGVVYSTLTAVGETIKERGGELAAGLLNSALSVISFVVFLVVVPVVTFYMLLDWDSLVRRIDALLPREHAPTIRRLAHDIDRVLASFVRGQVSVCVILGTFYAVALMLAGLDFGLVVGAFAGLVTFIPYVGALAGGILAIGLAFFQFWGEWGHIALVAGIFAVGQFMEGNIITPKLVGKSVGLHPVWLLFALSAFGSAFGFVGMLVAVPAAAAIGVLVRFGIERYQASRLYLGPGPDDAAAPQASPAAPTEPAKGAAPRARKAPPAKKAASG